MITWLPHEYDKLITWLLGQYKDPYNMIPAFSVCNFANLKNTILLQKEDYNT